MSAAAKDCPVCLEKRLHTPEETAEFHPLAGHGYIEQLGWSCEEARLAHEEDVARLKRETAQKGQSV